MSAGSFCLVLHGHLPWVLHHGRWPHGEDWLFEAASGTWLPLLEVLDQCREEGLRPAWTIGVTPILLEQLASPRFREGFPRWLTAQAEKARTDDREFSARGEPHLAYLATRWRERYTRLLRRFEVAERDIAGELVRAEGEGLIELLTSNATHGYHPLMLHDACARAQVRAGVATSERHLGHRPRGMWLPECAYRPPKDFWPPAVHGRAYPVSGTGSIVAPEGIRYFVVDTRLVTDSVPFAVLEGGRATPVPPEQGGWDLLRAWGSELEPHRVVEDGRVLDVTVFARSPHVSEQVWSGSVGYPGDERYLEFHKRHGQKGLQYWKVTGDEVDLGDKEPYHPDDIGGALHGQAQHFCKLITDRLWIHRDRTGRHGAVCAPFDAELFGHWWHEGPQFLLEVARALHHSEHVQCQTLGEVLAERPADKAVTMPEGSWGAGGDHRVWLNDELRFYWKVVVRAEDRFMELWHRVAWQTDERVRELLVEAGRQLLLLQSSDWPFVISTQGAVDYGLRRIFGHSAAFDDLCNGTEDAAAGLATDVVVEETLARSRLRDGMFTHLDLSWWA